jgi:hypothetical protein
MIITNHDYEVVTIIHIVIIKIIWSIITTEWLQHARITHVRECHGYSNHFHPCKGNNLTTRYSRVMKTPRVATVHDAIKETIRDHLTLGHLFHVIPRRASLGGQYWARVLNYLMYSITVWFPYFRSRNSFSLLQSRPTDRWWARKVVRNLPIKFNDQQVG